MCKNDYLGCGLDLFSDSGSDTNKYNERMKSIETDSTDKAGNELLVVDHIQQFSESLKKDAALIQAENLFVPGLVTPRRLGINILRHQFSGLERDYMNMKPLIDDLAQKLTLFDNTDIKDRLKRFDNTLKINIKSNDEKLAVMVDDLLSTWGLHTKLSVTVSALEIIPRNSLSLMKFIVDDPEIHSSQHVINSPKVQVYGYGLSPIQQL